MPIPYTFCFQVFIRGYEHLNRAMQGDSVVIEMLSKAEWSCPSSMVLEDDDQDKEEEEVMKEVGIVLYLYHIP